MIHKDIFIPINLNERRTCMEEKIYIVGHKNPDTDSICAAIGYCSYKRSMGIHNAYPARLGAINKETEFVLDYFNVDIPELISTVKMQVKDVGIDMVLPISPEVSVRKAWNIMKKQNIKTLPVVNSSGHLIGVCTLSDLTNNYMDVTINNLFSQSKTSVNNLVETISGKLLNNESINLADTNKIIIAAAETNDIENRIDNNDIVIVGNREDVQEQAIKRKAACLVITGGYIPSDNILKLSDDNKCMIISTPYDSFTTARLINQSIPVSYVMSTKDIISFDIDDYIDEIKDIMLDTRYRAYPVLQNNKVVGTISRYHLIKGKRKKVILVDHNERSQSVDGLEEAEILEIIDHHRIGDIQTSTPVEFYNRPLGSTSTIVGNLFFENGLDIPKRIAGILCGAIISDTLLFKSPTSTKTDEVVARKLSDIAGIDIYDFSNMMFKAGTSLAGRSPEEIFYQDFKEFYFGKKKIGIGQVITMDVAGIKSIKDQLLSLMERTSKDKDYDLLILMLTDIISDGSELLFTGPAKEIMMKAFGAFKEKNRLFLPGVVSRKKQVVPPIATLLSSNM